MTAKRIFLPFGVIIFIWGVILLCSPKDRCLTAAFIAACGIIIILLCRKAVKGYFTDFLLEHRLLLLFTAVHICSLLLLAYHLAVDDWGFVPFWFAEYVLAPGNIIGLVIAALNDYEETRPYKAERKESNE